jgi:nucleotide-binding universal stress UspA family protein
MTPAMITDILLTLTSFPAPTETRSIESAVAMAQNLRGQVSAIAFEMDIQLPIGLYADPLGVGSIVAADRKKSADNARNLLGIFETTARAHGIAHNHSLLRCAPIEISKRLVQEARFRDITMIPLKEGDAAQQEIAELLVFESGRPILVFPDDSRREVPTSLGDVAVAWNNSRPSTRAVMDALPILQQAKRVRVFSVIDGKPVTKAKGLAQLVSYLMRHNVDAIAEDVKFSGQAIVDAFEKYISEQAIDLLVMGAYGHSRLREFILGGATRSILSHPPTWVLLSH